MPSAAPRPCTYPACGQLVRDGSGRCPAHPVQRLQDRARGSANARGYTYKWQKASKSFLMQHPLCECEACGSGTIRVRAAEVVDHEPPHGGDMTKFWDRSTWRALAKSCHDAKTAREDGGFGNAPRADRRA